MKPSRASIGVIAALGCLASTAGPAGAQEAQAAPPAVGTAPAESPPPPAATAPVEGATAEGASKAGIEEEVIVTGSRVKRKDLTTPAPVTVLTREQFEASGKLTIGDFLQSIPEQGNAPNFQLNNGGVNYGADGSTRVSLRSLGTTRTLVLINGRRVVTSGLGASDSVDLNSIPAAAVDRIEVLKDGGSAIYGSDAIAGVVNIITRKAYNGTEATAQYGTSQHGDAQTFDAQVTTGRSNELGNFLFSAGYFNQQPSYLRDRSWAANALTYDYSARMATPGGSHRTPQGDVGLPTDANGNALPGCLANPLCNYLVTKLDPQNWQNDSFIHDPSAPMGFRVAGPNDLYNFASANYLTIPSTRVQVFSTGDTRWKSVRGYYEASYVQRNSSQNAAPFPLNPGDYTLGGGNVPISVSKDSLYNPFGVDLPFAGRRLVEFGDRTYSQELGTFRIVTGLEGTLPKDLGPLQGWFWDLSMNYGKTSGTFTTNGSIRNSKIAAAVGPSMLDSTGTPRCVSTPGDITTVIPGCVPLNLFGGPNNGSISPSQIAGLGFTGTSRAEDALFVVAANTTGELFHIMSDKPVSLALGYEFRRQSGAQIADPIAASGDSADFNFQSTQGFFTVNEAYGELAIPIISNVSGVKELEATVAGRFVDYNTFGTNFSYKLGLRYTPVRDVTLRGTFSTAFRAPSISELYLGQSETDPTVSDPCAFNVATASQALKNQCKAGGVPAAGSGDNGNQELTRTGGNASLQPETAKIFTVGAVIQPRMIPDLSITVDYYHIHVDNLVGTIGAAAILQGCYPGDAGTPNQTYCNLITRAAGSGRILYLTDVNQNVGQLATAGVDVAARYTIGTQFGRFGAGIDANFLGYFDRTQIVGTGTLTIHGKGNYDLGAMPALKMNISADWAYAGFLVGAIGHYVASITECAAADYTSTGGLCYALPAPLPSGNPLTRDVGANVVVDVHASYTLGSPLGKTTMQVGVNNVFDQAPQTIYSAALANSDPTIYDYVGRYVYGRLQQKF